MLDSRLGEEEFLAGDCSIADIACWPWVYCAEWTGIDLSEAPHLARWFNTLSSRPAIKRGLNVPVPFDINEVMNDENEVKKIEKQWSQLLGENNTEQD